MDISKGIILLTLEIDFEYMFDAIRVRISNVMNKFHRGLLIKQFALKYIYGIKDNPKKDIFFFFRFVTKINTKLGAILRLLCEGYKN